MVWNLKDANSSRLVRLISFSSDGRMLRPKRIDGRVVWDRIALDSAFSDLPDDDAVNELDAIFAQSRAA